MEEVGPNPGLASSLLFSIPHTQMILEIQGHSYEYEEEPSGGTQLAVIDFFTDLYYQSNGSAEIKNARDKKLAEAKFNKFMEENQRRKPVMLGFANLLFEPLNGAPSIREVLNGPCKIEEVMEVRKVLANFSSSELSSKPAPPESYKDLAKAQKKARRKATT